MKLIDVITQEPQAEDEVHYTKLNEVYDGSCDKLRLYDTPDLVEDRENYIKMAASKVSYNGVIELVGVDLLSLAYGITYGHIDTLAAKELLYKKPKRNISTTENTIALLQTLGFTILIKQLQNHLFYIQARRNG